ncbi:MAG TPA: hypothetical protein VF032_19470 [Thermoleophilaceae bacterium]
MSRRGAERAVVVSALVVIATYTYRLLTEGHSSSGGSIGQLVGIGAPPNIGRFITGWGFSFFILSILAEIAPSFGGSLAILAATGDVLGNAGQVAADVNRKLGAKPSNLAAAQRLARRQGATPQQVQSLATIDQITTPLIPGTIPAP